MPSATARAVPGGTRSRPNSGPHIPAMRLCMRILKPMPFGTRPSIAIVVVLVLLSRAPTAAAAAAGPVNLDLEDGALGQLPTGWTQPKASAEAGYRAQLTDENPKTGKRCGVIGRESRSEPTGLAAGRLGQLFDATPYRGKRVRFRAAVRSEAAGEDHQARIWLRVDRMGDRRGSFGIAGDRPATGKEWREYEVYGDVAEDAVSIELGLLLMGDGRAWLDAGSFEVVGRAGEGNEAARPLRDRATDNLVAFTKLLGYVRYFHPSGEAAATDWDRFAIDGVRVVEDAKTPAELAETLDSLFRPHAPTARVFPTGRPPVRGERLALGNNPPSDKCLAWFHYGVRTVRFQQLYVSERLDRTEPLPAIPIGTFPKVTLPDPGQPFTADLGAGVSCSIPLAVYADAKGTLPRPAADPRAPGWSKPRGFVPSGNDRATRLAAVVLAWNVFQHFYPYFDVVDANWPGELRLALTRAATDADADAFHTTLRRLVAAMHDGHGDVFTGDGPPSSFPPVGWDWVEGQLVVTRVGPGAAIGVNPGDVVTAINGRPTAEAVAAEEQLVSGETPQWKRYVSLRNLAVGPRDSEITLGILPAGGPAREVRLRRTLDTDDFEALREPRRAKVRAVKPGIVYVDLDQVTEKEFADALPQLEKAVGVIFDMRGYPKAGTEPISHLIEKPVNSPGWNIPVTVYPDRQNVAFHSFDWAVEPKGPRLKGKVAFLTDGRAISQAETHLGIIEHYKLGAIVGAPTAGTNGDINLVLLPGDYRAVWTGMKVLRHDGSRHHGVGIRPTVPVARTIRGVAEGRDEVLERAIEVVGS